MGVFIDCHLNWKDQILYVKKKVLKSICIMYKVRWKLNGKFCQFYIKHLLNLTYNIAVKSEV